MSDCKNRKEFKFVIDKFVIDEEYISEEILAYLESKEMDMELLTDEKISMVYDKVTKEVALNIQNKIEEVLFGS